MPELMVSDKAMRVVSHGADATFRPGIERMVRDSLVKPAEKMGARIVSAKATISRPTEFTTDTPDEKPDDEAIEAVIQHMLDDNQYGGFGANGAPKVRSIEAILGANIDAADRDRVWGKMNG